MPPPASCAPGGAGMTDCGATGESCCTSLEVDGGTYYRTYDTLGESLPDGGWTDEADPAAVSGFRLDKYLVTVGRFRQFVAAWNGGAGYLPAEGSGKHTHLNAGQGLVNSGPTLGSEPGWVASDDAYVAPLDTNLNCDLIYATWTSSPATQEDLPINCVTWQEAYAFCIWDGGFLPSEAEWEYAAAGGSQQLEYPWGTANAGTNNQYAIYGCDYPSGTGTCSGVANIAPVGTATQGGGFWGQLDMVGEVWEWGLDWYASYANPCIDCAYVTVAFDRVVRGGYFDDNASYLLPADRGRDPATNREYYNGFRCARAP